MNNGKTILTGLAIWLVFLIQFTLWGGLHKLCVLIAGLIPLILFGVGALLLVLGINDLKAGKAEPKTAAS